MTQKQQIQLFEAKKVRTVWDDELEEWFFSVVDVVDVLTDSKDPTDYLKKMRKRDPQLKAYMGTNCPQITMLTKTGKPRKTLAANTEQLFRVIQAIPSAKAEPFREWMAQVAAQRIDQMQDPELNFEQAYAARQGCGPSATGRRRAGVAGRGGLNRPARNSGHRAHGIWDNPLPGGHTEKGWIPHGVRRFFFFNINSHELAINFSLISFFAPAALG